MKSKLITIWVVILISVFAFCMTGCANSANSNSVDNTETVVEEDSIEYEGKTISFNDVEISVPTDWSEQQDENTISFVSNDNSITGTLMHSPIEGAPEHPYVIANSAKLVFTQFCPYNGFTTNVDLKYEAVNGYPCYYTTHVAKDNAGEGVYSDIYVLGFQDHAVIVLVNYLEQEQSMADAILSTLTTTEPASAYVASISNSLDANINPADLYNLEQEIIDKAARDAGAKRSEQKQREPTVGMTENEVLNSAWGSPKDKNVTITKYGTHEQWVYPHNRYVYFDDGIVSAVQK